MEIKIGTRGSKLALWQAQFVQEQLAALKISGIIKVIETTGDKILDRALSKIGSKGVFTEELETQLRTGEIDIAVHSAKDLQSKLDNDLELIAFTIREKTNDVLVSHKELTLNEEITVGTSSTRRVAMLKAYYPHIRVADIRGNLQTRIEKMKEGTCDALLLAYAGIHRMGYNELIRVKIGTEKFTPAVGQGSIAIQALKTLDNEKASRIKQACNHTLTASCIKAERSFLEAVQGGCSIPVFGNAYWANDREIELNAGIISLDGKKVIRVQARDEYPEKLGIAVATQLLQKGGQEILEEIKAKL